MRYGATILDASGLRLTAQEKALFRAVKPFGFILFARNIDTPDQVRALCDELREAAGHEAVITVDQEGGRVQRLRAPHWRDWTAPLDFVQAAGPNAAEAMYLRFRLIADELHRVGIDSNCAPMVDVAGAQTHAFLRNRCYGTTPDAVAALGRAAADGMLAGGVLPVVKHMPGHGLDTHDFAPFKVLNDLPMGMTAHLVYDAIDPRPATLSPVMMQLIREDIGFDNLIMTDDISMKALTGEVDDIAAGALAAGCDVVLYCNATLEDRTRVADAAGEMSEAAQTRAVRALAMRRTPDDVDIPALTAKLDRLLGGTVYG